MTATYVTSAELKANLGIGSLYADSIVEEVCQTAEDLLNQYLWFDSYPVIAATIQNNVATIVLSAPVTYSAGQTITISGTGTAYNGSHTITATYPWTYGSGSFPVFAWFPWNYYTFPKGYSLIQFALTHADDNYHQIVPYGKAMGVDIKDVGYAQTPAIREAAMNIAVDVWQARQSSNAGSISPDFQPSPYRMGNSLMGRVRGLIAPYISPRSMIG